MSTLIFSQIVRERLEYALVKNRCVLFDISLNERKINKKLFLESEYAYEVEENLSIIIFNQIRSFFSPDIETKF